MSRNTPDALNLGQYLRRMGFKRQDEPPLLFSVQPVQIVSDVRGLASPVRPPSGMLGGVHPGLALENVVFQFQARASGGVFMTMFGGGNTFVYGFSGAPTVLNPGNIIQSRLSSFTPDFAPVTTAQLGTIDAVQRVLWNDGTRAAHRGSFGNLLEAKTGVWVPPGVWFIAMMTVIAAIGEFEMIFEEPAGDRAS